VYSSGTGSFYEPELEEIVRDTVADGHFPASTGLAGALKGAEILLICVGTPSARKGTWNWSNYAV
jgi:UDP-glucose 6-dehydrogenase